MSEIPKKPPSAREKIAKLRQTFIAQLPARVLEMRALFERLQADATDRPAAVELHRFLHSIKGTGRSFGFLELGAAEQAENLVALLIAVPPQPLPANWQKQLGDSLGYLEMTVEVLCSPDGLDAGSDEPGFAMVKQAESVRDHSGGRVVYICDDESLVLEKLASQLSCFGFTTVCFTDTEALHQAVLAEKPDALVMDINFPQGQCAGTQVIAALKSEIGNSVPVVFVSGRDDFSARLGAVQAGGDAYFQKPARLIDLVMALDELTNPRKPAPFRILVIDDEPGISSYHCIILQEAGMETVQLNTPARVLDVLREFRPDMVLMDMYMPECSGRDLAMLIRQVPDFIGLPIVFLSSETDQQKQFSAMRVGAEDFLTKPVIPADLVTAVAIRAERMRTLCALMARDSLTGLFNHTTTTQLLDSAISSARRTNESLCFVMIDIDRFKLVNDTHGHPAGDQVILALSRVLHQRLRNSDIVGRYGGEEFAIIMQNVSVVDASRLINELREDFARVVFHSANGEFTCSFSAGIASFPDHQRLELLREAADKALYKAKDSGRNCVMVDQ